MPRAVRPPWVLTHRRQIGHHIARLRAAQDLTVEQLAERAGLDRKSVLRAEGGSVSTGVDVLIQLAHGLGITLAGLVDVGEVPAPPPVTRDA